MLENVFEAVKKASREVALLSDEVRNRVLLAVAEAMDAAHDDLLRANATDLSQMNPENPLYDRLLLTPRRLADIANDVRHVAALPSPSVGCSLSARCPTDCGCAR